MSEPYVTHESRSEAEAWNDAVRGAVMFRTLISADRTPTEGLTLGVADVRQSDALNPRLHRHAQAEAYYVLSGEGVLRIDGVDHPLSAGSTAFIPGGALHGARATSTEPLRLLYVFAADSFDKIVYEFPDVPNPDD